MVITVSCLRISKLTLPLHVSLQSEYKKPMSLDLLVVLYVAMCECDKGLEHP